MKMLQKTCEQLVSKSLTSCELLAANYIAVTMAETTIPGAWCRVNGVWCMVVPHSCDNKAISARLSWSGAGADLGN